MAELASVLKNVPSQQWWDDATQSFEKIQRLLQRGVSVEEGDKYFDVDEDTRKIRLIRKGYLPRICLLPSDTYPLRLTATNEALNVTAFGTMGPKLFVKLFWEAIEDEPIVVHQISGSQILMTVDTYEFKLTFVQAETLLPNYPNPFEAPVSFLKYTQNCSEQVQNAMRGCMSGWGSSESRVKGATSPDQRLAYHYRRDLSIERGLWNPGYGGVSPVALLQLCEPLEEADLFILPKVSRKQLHEKLQGFSYFIRISLMYTGFSKVTGAEWIFTTDRKIDILKERLALRLNKPKDLIRVWPERLVSTSSTDSDDVYEGYIVIALNLQSSAVLGEDSEDIITAEDVCHRWLISIKADSTPDHCFINLDILQGSSMLQGLVRDERIWPKPIVKPEENRTKVDADASVTKKLKSHSASNAKHNASTPDMKGPKLRPASHVLNRLRYDKGYDIDQCIMGYKDRHTSKIQEKPAADWMSDTTHEEFIPEHRIEYFKRGAEVVWDKTSRVDKVFGSGGQT